MGHYNIVFKLFFFFPKLKFYFSTRKEGLQKFFFLTTNPNHTLTVKNFFFLSLFLLKSIQLKLLSFLFIYFIFYEPLKLLSYDLDWLGLVSTYNLNPPPTEIMT